MVLYWRDDGLVNAHDFGLGLKCNRRCTFTNNRSFFPEADAVILHKNLQLSHRHWPKRRNRNQIFVAPRFEPPSKYGLGGHIQLFRTLNHPLATDYFNMTFSYRQDSDVVLRFHEFLPRTKETKESLNLPVNKPRKQAVWIDSNCDTPIKREKFVEQLQKYISIDVYGKCGKSLDDVCEYKLTNENITGKNYFCLHDIVKDYKFYIAFENSLCVDYLTEKAAQFMNTPSLPIVMSYTQVDNFLPSKSYINAFDFKSIKELAEYIIYLDNNFEEYMKYFTWRHKWRVETLLKIRPKAKCDLCELLHTNYHKTYRNLAQWFAGPNVCSLDGLQKHFSDFKPKVEI